MPHTPGPWTVEIGNVGSEHPLFVIAPGKDGLRPWCDDDAYLIAAGPDLLAALRNCIGWVPHRYDNIKEALSDAPRCSPDCDRCAIEAAIAKAEGR